MTTYTHTASSPRFAHLRAHLPAYLVGIGATAALTAGALVVFLSLATFVAFNGLPFGGSSDDVGVGVPRPEHQLAPAAGGDRPRAAPGAVARNAAASPTGRPPPPRPPRRRAPAAPDPSVRRPAPPPARPPQGLAVRLHRGRRSLPQSPSRCRRPPVPSPTRSRASTTPPARTCRGPPVALPARSMAPPTRPVGPRVVPGQAGGAVNAVRDRVLGGAGAAGGLLGR